ncbi:LysR family transcriptional regulator [Duganella sp. LX20W]|uniref:LysR family transcriptional regulator n=1 Tax=Rugamonas brunnea TaxID=2758569 RepID=A0A7W2EWX3_9BURK|nr:LysR family transcriptional regulator [Rugamonas brunnea]MBA5640129.1 LysR family transcriptional regulator [Rugamonas brunnea]
MRKLDSHALEVFVAVATCLNFRQAAEQLHMTQPPLSRAIRQLESRLATQLFERDTRHVTLTPAGRQLLPMAQRILAMLDAAELAMRDHPAPMRVRLGLTSSMEADLFRPFTEALAAAQGGPLDPVFATSPQLVAGVRAGRLDAAVIALPTATRELAVLTLGRQPMLAALSSAHPLARRRSVTLADLASEPVYWFERARQPAFFDHCHAVFKRHQFAPPFVREPHDHHVLLSDVAAGKGIALLPASFAALRRRGVAYRKLAEGEELAAGLGLVTAPGHPAADMLADLARRTLA